MREIENQPLMTETRRKPQDRSFTGGQSTASRNPVRPTGLVIRGQGAAVAVALQEKWSREDPEEQRETWEYLKRALHEDRLSSRKHFA